MTSARPGPLVGVVLAAGASRRAGGPKPLARWRGRTFLDWTTAALNEGGCASVSVVLGPPHGETLRASVGHPLWNPAPERGQLSSLRCAIEAHPDADALVAHLVDHPRVQARTVAALIETRRRTGAPVVRPRFGEKRGHPYLLGRELFPRLLSETPEGGLRALFACLPAEDRPEVMVDDPGILDDLDTPERIAAIGATVPRSLQYP